MRMEIQIFDARHELLVNQFVWFHAVLNGCVVGQINANSLVHDADSMNTWWLNDFYVHPDHRRKGFGTRLFRAAVQYCFEQKNCVTVSAGIKRDNSASIETFRQAGFRLVLCYQDGDLLYSRIKDE